MSDEQKRVGGDDINSTTGDNARNIATGKRIDQDNRSNAINFYEYSNTTSPRTYEERLGLVEQFMTDLTVVLYGNQHQRKEGFFDQYDEKVRDVDSRLSAHEKSLKEYGARQIVIAPSTAVLLTIIFFLLVAVGFLFVSWLQTSGPKQTLAVVLRLVALLQGSAWVGGLMGY